MGKRPYSPEHAAAAIRNARAIGPVWIETAKALQSGPPVVSKVCKHDDLRDEVMAMEPGDELMWRYADRVKLRSLRARLFHLSKQAGFRVFGSTRGVERGVIKIKRLT